MQSYEEILASLASREATSAVDPDIGSRHGKEKMMARKLILAKLRQYESEYRRLPVITEHGGIGDAAARAVRRRVVNLLRNAPLTHGFKVDTIFSNTDDLGDKMKNCWHLKLGGSLRERAEERLFQYSGPLATDQMKKYSAGGEKSDTFHANTRPFYAALNYSNAKYGGSSSYGKTHLVMKHIMRFNATFTYCDSFGVTSTHTDNSQQMLANYHNMYPIILNVMRGERSKSNPSQNDADILKSMIDYALELKSAPDEEFGGSHYVEAQIPGDIVYSRDIEKVVVASAEVNLGSQAGKNFKKFCKKHNLKIEIV